MKLTTKCKQIMTIYVLRNFSMLTAILYLMTLPWQKASVVDSSPYIPTLNFYVAQKWKMDGSWSLCNGENWYASHDLSSATHFIQLAHLKFVTNNNLFTITLRRNSNEYVLNIFNQSNKPSIIKTNQKIKIKT